MKKRSIILWIEVILLLGLAIGYPRLAPICRERGDEAFLRGETQRAIAYWQEAASLENFYRGSEIMWEWKDLILSVWEVGKDIDTCRGRLEMRNLLADGRGYITTEAIEEVLKLKPDFITELIQNPDSAFIKQFDRDAILNELHHTHGELSKWHEVAADAGDAQCAWIVFARLINTDIVKSAHYCEIAADNGWDEAKKLLPNVLSATGKALAFGERGVTKDLEKAVVYFQKAADLGQILAQKYLGIFAMKGIVGEPSVENATKWFRKAAEQDDTEAQLYLGMLLDGPEKEDWLRKAAAGGDANASFLLQEIEYEKWVKAFNNVSNP